MKKEKPPKKLYIGTDKGIEEIPPGGEKPNCKDCQWEKDGFCRRWLDGIKTVAVCTAFIKSQPPKQEESWEDIALLRFKLGGILRDYKDCGVNQEETIKKISNLIAKERHDYEILINTILDTKNREIAKEREKQEASISDVLDEELRRRQPKEEWEKEIDDIMIDIEEDLVVPNIEERIKSFIRQLLAKVRADEASIQIAIRENIENQIRQEMADQIEKEIVGRLPAFPEFNSVEEMSKLKIFSADDIKEIIKKVKA
jgi:hypothetical protein